METPLVSVAEYLSTSYHPDREYIDGRVIERNLGERAHSATQGDVVVYLAARSDELGIEVFPGVRVQVSPTRFRVPDVTVVKVSQEQGEIFTNPPHLCIEILSKDDTMQYMQEKIDDYLNFGVAYAWIINPRNRKGYVVTLEGMFEAKSGILETRDPGDQGAAGGIVRGVT
jgi:Uma2 family endonuclease